MPGTDLSGLPRREFAIACSGGMHDVVYESGQLTAPAHDMEAERTAQALGADIPECLHAVRAWNNEPRAGMEWAGFVDPIGFKNTRRAAHIDTFKRYRGAVSQLGDKAIKSLNEMVSSIAWAGVMAGLPDELSRLWVASRILHSPASRHACVQTMVGHILNGFSLDDPVAMSDILHGRIACTGVPAVLPKWRPGQSVDLGRMIYEDISISSYQARFGVALEAASLAMVRGHAYRRMEMEKLMSAFHEKTMLMRMMMAECKVVAEIGAVYVRRP